MFMLPVCRSVRWKAQETEPQQSGTQATQTYNVPSIRSEFQVTQANPRSSLMMAEHCRNM
jgi:hypothetical protein